MADNSYSPALLRDDERPDKIGLMVNIDTVEMYGPVLVVHELRAGAVDENDTYIERLADHCTVVVRRMGQGRLER